MKKASILFIALSLCACDSLLETRAEYMQRCMSVEQGHNESDCRQMWADVMIGER